MKEGPDTVRLATIILVALTMASPALASGSEAEDRADGGSEGRPERFEAVVVEDQQPRFTGEPISLSLKDADVKDVLKTFAELSQLNVVVDPEVSGSVTVELREVPWDQALDLILRMNGLGWALTGNVLYVAPRARLLTIFAAARP